MISKKLKSLKEIKILLGIELEFYLKDKSLDIQNIKEIEIKKEIGENQFEAIFPLNFNIHKILKDVIIFKNKFKDILNFESYITENDPNSSMQFNFSLWKDEQNIMENENIRNAIIYSLLKFLPENINSFIENENCIKRLTDLEKIKKFRNSPFNISCGSGSNRTAAIRLINELSAKYGVQGYRIEHRVPSSSASVLKSFDAILEAIIFSLSIKNAPKIPIIHSNAFEEEVIKEFNLKPLI